MRVISGTSHGVQISGLLPEEFRRYLTMRETVGTDLPTLALSYAEATSPPPVRDELWARVYPAPEGSSRLALSGIRDDLALSIHCRGSGVFSLRRGSVAISWTPGGSGAEHYFFHQALPLWLELRGVPVLHASAVARDGCAIALLGPSGGGKSTLCAAMIRLGWQFLGDDSLALHGGKDGAWFSYPAPPLLRLWPGAAEVLGEHDAADASAEDKRSLPVPAGARTRLAAIYLLERRADASAVQVLDQGRASALAKLLAHSLCASPGQALGLATERLRTLGAVAAGVPVRRLIYPDGPAALPDIEAALQRGIAACEPR